MRKSPDNITDSRNEADRPVNDHRDAWYNVYETRGGTRESADDSLRLLMRLFDEAPAPYIVTDDHLVVCKVNAAAQRLLNRPLRELDGKPLSVIVAASDLKAFRRSIREAVMSGTGTINRPLRIRPAGAKAEREVLVSARVLLGDDGETEFVCWVLHDPDRSLAGDIL